MSLVQEAQEATEGDQEGSQEERLALPCLPALNIWAASSLRLQETDSQSVQELWTVCPRIDLKVAVNIGLVGF